MPMFRIIPFVNITPWQYIVDLLELFKLLEVNAVTKAMSSSPYTRKLECSKALVKAFLSPCFRPSSSCCFTQHASILEKIITSSFCTSEWGSISENGISMVQSNRHSSRKGLLLPGRTRITKPKHVPWLLYTRSQNQSHRYVVIISTAAPST